MGIPGFSGFAAEITILIGAWKAFPVAVWITGIGMVLVAAFTLRALKTIILSMTASRAAGACRIDRIVRRRPDHRCRKKWARDC